MAATSLATPASLQQTLSRQLVIGDDATQQHYASVSGIDVVLDTRVTDINLDAAGKHVATLDLFHLPSGRKATIPVKMLFLATGGIENPRLMLWSARKYQAGNPLAGGVNRLTGIWDNRRFQECKKPFEQVDAAYLYKTEKLSRHNVELRAVHRTQIDVLFEELLQQMRARRM